MKKSRHTRGGATMTELVLEVFRVNGLLLAAGDRLTRDLHLTSARWQVMGALAEGALTAARIARNMGLQRQSVQRLVDVLAAEGIVEFEPNPEHRRAKLVRLTGIGRSKYEAISQIQVRWVNELSKGLDAGEIAATLTLLQTLEERLQRQLNDTNPRS